MTVIIKFKKEHPNFVLPIQETEGAAGFDMRFLPEDNTPVTLKPLQRELLSLGCKVEIPHGYELQLRPRSGLAKKHGITLLNSPGTVDSDYRGMLGAIVVNLSDAEFTIEPEMRICQAVISRVDDVSLEEAEVLSSTNRGEGGFGSTGHK